MERLHQQKSLGQTWTQLPPQAQLATPPDVRQEETSLREVRDPWVLEA